VWRAPWAASVSAAMRRTVSSGSTTGSMPFWKQLPKKMSPKEGAMTARNPMPIRAQTAPSREEPQPKFGPARRMGLPRYCGRLSTKSGLSDPSAR